MGEFMGKRDEYEMMKKKKKKENSSDVVRWEKFLPSMALRILLVESDDSTRQIIAALLRKCSYIVAAVPDGLKAWETLKRRPHNIDLILTEVDLPSISGYALLTLIMEHEICKNIPVIMMSTQDSVSLVLKCMLKGAADFLVKPVRRNELKNLWQHVWRRQTNHQQAVGYVTKDTPIAENKVEATSEDNTSSTHSSDYLVSIEKNKECSEKGSDAQSSCTTPCLEVENAHMPSMQGLSQLKCSSESNLSHAEQEICMGMADKSVLSKSDTGGKSTTSELESASCLIAYNSTAFRMEEDQGCTEEMMREASVGPESCRENTYITSEIHCHTDERVEPSTRAIDLIGNFDNHLPGIYRPCSAYDVMPKFNFAPQLELSLRRFHDDHSKNEGNDEMHSLNHSNVSAFSRYDNKKTLQPLFPTLASNEHSESTTALFVGESGLSEAAFSSPQCGIVPVPGVRFGNICAGYDRPPIVYTQPGYPPAWIPRSVGPQEFSSSEIHSSEQGHSTIDVTINHSADLTVEEEDSYLESGGGLCDGSASKINSSVCGSICDASDGDATPAAAVARTTASESVNDNRVPIHDGSRGMESNCSTQREAALMKYRLKRKERHFEKKVRYESRKRLAEQRPRVKGQFVRRMQIDPPSSTIDACLT